MRSLSGSSLLRGSPGSRGDSSTSPQPLLLSQNQGPSGRGYSGFPLGCPKRVPGIILLFIGFQLGWLLTGPLPLSSSPFSLSLSSRETDKQGSVPGTMIEFNLLSSRLKGIERSMAEMAASRSLQDPATWLDPQGVSHVWEQERAEKKGTGSDAEADSAAEGDTWRPGACARSLARNQETMEIDPEGTVEWHPQKNRYLLAMCSGGQLSNRLACLRQNMLDAALTNRTLVIPTHGIDYNYEQLLDLEAMSVCFGPGRVVSLDEYAARYPPKQGGPIRVDRAICHIHTYQTEEVCGALRRRYKEVLNLEFLRQDVAKRRTPGPWFKYPSTDFLRKFGGVGHVRLLAFSNMFGVGGRELKFKGTAPLKVSTKCRGFLVPSKAIQDVAVGFVNMFLGSTFAAVHWRRGDFFEHCLRGAGKHRTVPCYQPLQQVAKCLAGRTYSLQSDYLSPFHPHPVAVLFLATNADDVEIRALDAALQAYSGRKVALVRLPTLTSRVASHWSEPLTSAGLGESAEVISLVDKTICAMSTYFFGTPGSTYSNDVLRLREWWQKGEGCDAYICPPQMKAEVLPFSSANSTLSKKEGS